MRTGNLAVAAVSTGVISVGGTHPLDDAKRSAKDLITMLAIDISDDSCSRR